MKGAGKQTANKMKKVEITTSELYPVYFLDETSSNVYAVISNARFDEMQGIIDKFWAVQDELADIREAVEKRREEADDAAKREYETYKAKFWEKKQRATEIAVAWPVAEEN